MNKLIGLIFAVTLLAASAACGQEKAEAEAPRTPPQVTLSKELGIAYPDGCDKGFDRIHIELQPGTEFTTIDIECGKVVKK